MSSSIKIPTETRVWTVTEQTPKSTKGLQQTSVRLPPVGPTDILVRIHAASLNYRDLLILQGGYPFPVKPFPIIPLSDGAGEIMSVGTQVTTLNVGDKVMTVFNQGHQHGELTQSAMHTGLGGALHGVAAEYVVLPSWGVSKIPKHMSYVEAATLPCAAVTAWNGLYGMKQLQPGESVLVQGTGGVSCFALQFAKAAGAWVFATTSSNEKADRLKEMGADVVVNYREEQDWGAKAKALAPGKEGIHNVIDVGGMATLKQSFEAVKLEGQISSIGLLGQSKDSDVNPLTALANVCTLRGIFVGSKKMMEEMTLAMEVNKIKPVVDERVFKFDQMKEAYEYQMSQKHFGNVVVRIAE